MEMSDGNAAAAVEVPFVPGSASVSGEMLSVRSMSAMVSFRPSAKSAVTDATRPGREAGSPDSKRWLPHDGAQHAVMLATRVEVFDPCLRSICRMTSSRSPAPGFGGNAMRPVSASKSTTPSP